MKLHSNCEFIFKKVYYVAKPTFLCDKANKMDLTHVLGFHFGKKTLTFKNIHWGEYIAVFMCMFNGQLTNHWSALYI